MTKLVAVQDFRDACGPGGDFDAVVVVAPRLSEVDVDGVREAVGALAGIDDNLDHDLRLLAAEVAGGRLVLAPTGKLTREHDDVRRFADAAARGVVRARDAGARRPALLVAGVPADEAFEHAVPVAAMAALGALWEPLEAREARGAAECEPVETVGVASLGGTLDASALTRAEVVEQGRRLARDLCGTEPERMAPARFAEHCVTAFEGLPVRVDVRSDVAEIRQGYPLLAAVARASLVVERHQPRIVRLEYAGEGPIETTLLLAGKGVTYDTGGADIKAGGHMAGMSRDKGGAAAVAGFVAAVARLAPRGLRVVAELGVVRNGVGADAYVSDEIIESHAGVRVRIGNTDAEGRLVLADLLSHLRETAAGAPSPRLLSVATLTGHAVRAVGPYSIAVDNRPARQLGIAARLAEVGDSWGDPFDPSRLRREDWDFVRPRSRADDVLSCNNAASSATPRGHQFPVAFLAIASGLDAHSHRDAETPLPFTHIDIGGSAVQDYDWQHGRPTAAPVVSLVHAFVP